MNQVWSWVLSGFGVTAIVLLSRGVRAGLLVGIAGQLLWVVFGLRYSQWGFVVGAVAFITAYGVGWLAWSGERGGDVPAEVTCRCPRLPVAQSWGGDTVVSWHRTGASPTCTAHGL